jgi:hypothetical protein
MVENAMEYEARDSGVAVAVSKSALAIGTPR